MQSRTMIVLILAALLAGPANAPAQQGTRLSAEELALWNDPDFQRAFTESYIAETEIEPTVTIDERDIMQEVLNLISSDQMDEAADMLREEIEANEAASAVFDFTLANIHFQRDELEEAAGHYERAVEKFPKFRRAWKNLGIIRIRQGEHAEALPVLTRVVELGGADAIIYGLLGFAYSSVEEFLPAESAYRMAILLDPDTLDWQMGLARSFFKQQRFAEAAALCGQLIRENPESADLWLLQANAYIGLERPMDAAEVYELVDAMGKATVASLNMLGDIYINEELYGLAVDAYIRAMDLEPSRSPDRAIRSARILAARGAFEETGRLIGRINTLHGETLPDEDRKALLKIEARLAVAAGEGDEEVRVLEEIVELDPLDGEALILLGQHSQRTGDVEKAIFYYERAAGIEGHEADAKLTQAQLLVSQGKYREALPLLRRVQQVEPRDNVQEYLEAVERLAKAN